MGAEETGIILQRKRQGKVAIKFINMQSVALIEGRCNEEMDGYQFNEMTNMLKAIIERLDLLIYLKTKKEKEEKEVKVRKPIK